MRFFEMFYIMIYFFIAIVAAILLYPFSFLISDKHHEENGYDY
jgi:hypothetical protein